MPQNSPDPCPVCYAVMADLESLQLHVESHFTAPHQSQDTDIVQPAVTPSSHPSTQKQDPHPTLQGLVRCLRDLSLPSGSTRHLSSPHLVLHSSVRLPRAPVFDCGYRNVQTMLSVLLLPRSPVATVLRRTLPQTMPALPQLQAQIEKSWQDGFDPDGAAHFGHALVGKRVWIGSVEVAALLRSCGLRTHIADFDPRQSQTARGTHQGMFNWCYRYFQQACSPCRPCCSCGGNAHISPVFLQGQGHSVSVVGAERDVQGNIVLFMADPEPAFRTRFSRRPGAAAKLSLFDLQEPQYQIVFVDRERPLYQSSQELEQGKLLENIFTMDPASVKDCDTPDPDRARCAPIDVVDLT